MYEIKIYEWWYYVECKWNKNVVKHTVARTLLTLVIWQWSESVGLYTNGPCDNRQRVQNTSRFMRQPLYVGRRRLVRFQHFCVLRLFHKIEKLFFLFWGYFFWGILGQFESSLTIRVAWNNTLLHYLEALVNYSLQ